VFFRLSNIVEDTRGVCSRGAGNSWLRFEKTRLEDFAWPRNLLCNLSLVERRIEVWIEALLETFYLDRRGEWGALGEL
jgi:hypothetical protein